MSMLATPSPDVAQTAPARAEAPSFWKTVWLLLSIARRRSGGRKRRQQQILNQRRGQNSSINLTWFGFLFAILFMLLVNGFAVVALYSAVTASQRLEVEQQGKIVVSSVFRNSVRIWVQQQEWQRGHPDAINRIPQPFYTFEAKNIVREYGGSASEVEQKLRDSVRAHGDRDFITTRRTERGIRNFTRSGPLPALLAAIVLLWWGVMLIFQGEGLELDIQRQRHPLWEWLFSHPVQPGAVFLAEMLSPIAANPIYWGAPLFPAIVYGILYGPARGALAFLLVGVPLSVTAACLGKALEIGIILRFSVRTRGAIVGLMSWAGYASFMLFMVGPFLVAPFVTAIGKPLLFLSGLPWPSGLSLFALFTGARADGNYSLLSGVLACWLAAVLGTAAAVSFSIWGAQRGLAGAVSRAPLVPSRSAGPIHGFGKDPLYRKEFLWFVRDRSAIVQSILIPLTVASVQLFNMRGLLVKAQGEWNYLCGAAILFGTYFLWILGPKSLASEGQALWIPLTWPRGLESLLKAKAWLWSLIASAVVLLVLLYAAFLFPADAWRIALVGVAWFFFARSMAEKSVTLVTVTSESGEIQRIPWGRRGATQLGMLTFAIGVLTQQWHIAVMGIVYSWVTAAAIWQNFRARLPFLFDPWSEKLPPPPTTMHAMVAISLLVEGGAILSALMLLIVGRDQIAIARTIGYAVCSVLVAFGTMHFLSNRYVEPHMVWNWSDAPPFDPYDLDTPMPPDLPWWERWRLREKSLLPHFLLGILGGLLLGIFAHGYQAILLHIPATAELVRSSQEAMAKVPGMKLSWAIAAIGFAPFAEEYLFRGLLYRALDREWGGWRAILASAAFFALYHPPLAWLPVALLGVANALLFKKTGRLAPAVLLHMVYNAVVLYR